MSLKEIGHRTIQQFQKQVEKRGLHINHAKQNFDTLLRDYHSTITGALPAHLTKEFLTCNILDFFGHSIIINRAIDWHLDISTGKRFPLFFAKDMEIRSGKYGSAKVVWEVNRLQFLLPLAIRYNVTKKKEDLSLWMDLVESWVKANPYLKGVNWYSNIEVNIRLIVWQFCWQVLWQNDSLQNDQQFKSFCKNIWLPSIYEHCVYSFNNPSKYSSANNHLIAEYSGLFVASCCWNFEEARKWKLYAKEGLEKEMVSQHSNTGINKEEAAEYIQFITDFFLIAYAVGTKAGVSFSENYTKHLFKISEYIANLLDAGKNYRKYGDEDDGKVLVLSCDPYFDNFSSILVSAAVIFNEKKFKSISQQFDLKNWILWSEQGFDKFERIPLEAFERNSAFYKEEGHFIFRKTDGKLNKEIYLHFNAAPLGYLSIAAHGHSDSLSIALHIDGNPIIVDTGTYTYYTEKEWRNYFIGTLAHNTISIDQLNQAKQGGPMMWLRHYNTQVLEVKQFENKELVSACHDGYKFIRCSHQRTIHFDRTNSIFKIIDEIGVNKKHHDILLPWHLHPLVQVNRLDEQSFLLKYRMGKREVKITCDPSLEIKLVSGQLNPILGWFSPSFMQKEPTRVILGKMHTGASQKVQLTTIIEIVQ